MLVDAKALVVDPLVIILDPVKDDCTSFKGLRVVRIRQVTIAELL